MSPEFASLQLLLVDRFVQLGIGTHAEGVHQLTNFQRRLGLGVPTDPPSNQLWIDLLKTINAASDHEARVAVRTIEFRAMLGKKFNYRNDLVLFEFSQQGIPLNEEVCCVDLPSLTIK